MAGLRVIRGRAKGVRLKAVPGDTTRPVTDRVKEALFNILGMDVIESAWLDLFAGTGSIGIEALSGGASFVRFIDQNRAAVATIKANLLSTKLAQMAEVLQMDAFQLLQAKADRQFDYVYVAPPQYKGLWKRALLAIDRRIEWLAEAAWVIVQVHPIEEETLDLENLVEIDRRKYGSTLLIFYSRRTDEHDTLEH
jgi:16S rRNA (guanine966-N2)-methyltransferase